MKDAEVKKAVREGYARIAQGQTSCCGTPTTCCGSDRTQEISKGIGYSDEDLGSVPEGANLGLGCGNPIALASLKVGETVLDLGSGAGFDCFLAAARVGQSGRVIGVDMTQEMLDKARQNAIKGGYDNVEFRLGEIENLPVADGAIDAIISNCVINLSPNKRRVFAEAYRVLRPGGRLMVSDMVLLKPLPPSVLSSVAAYVGCISGAMLKRDYLDTIKSAGFQQITVVEETNFPVQYMDNDPTAAAMIKDSGMTPETLAGVSDSVLSIRVSAVKPK